MISQLIGDASFRVRSLTTICTPHYGSTFADWCYRSASRLPELEAALRRFGLDNNAVKNLTIDYCTNVFNKNIPDDPSVRYFSFGASTQVPTWSVLWFAYEMIRRTEGDNDGMVSVQSSRWGTYVDTLEASHWDVVGRRRLWRPSTQFDAVKLYRDISSMLYKEGF